MNDHDLLQDVMRAADSDEATELFSRLSVEVGNHTIADVLCVVAMLLFMLEDEAGEDADKVVPSLTAVMRSMRGFVSRQGSK